MGLPTLRSLCPRLTHLWWCGAVRNITQPQSQRAERRFQPNCRWRGPNGTIRRCCSGP